MKLADFISRAEIANNETDFADSLILIYTDSSDVRGPFVGEADQFEAYDRAIATGRPFKFEAWNRLG